jgi:hypothetical protein
MAMHPLVATLRKMKIQRASLEAANNERAKIVASQQLVIQEGAVSTADPQALEEALSEKLPGYLTPGNIGPISDVLWPFWFSFSTAELPPNSNGTGTVTITQEAPFILMALTKSVFLRTTGPDQLTYINPDVPGAGGGTPGLAIAMRDAQSSRTFFQRPVKLDHIGLPRFPTVLPGPMLFLPNSTIQISYFNANATQTYLPFVTLFGYRLRFPGSEEVLSTIFG